MLTVPVWQTPGPGDAAIFLGLGAVGALGQFLLIRSLTLAEAGAVAPFGYAGVVFATLLGRGRLSARCRTAGPSLARL